MASKIPERFVLPLTILSSLRDDSFAQILDHLAREAFLPYPEALTEAFEKYCPDLAETDARDLSLYIQAMARIAVSPAHREIEDVLSEMVQGSNLELTSEKRSLAQDRALALVQSDAVQTLAYIMESFWEHEKTVTDVKVSVDVRPAFDGKQNLLAMTSWQTLLVTYRDGSDTKSVDFALDKDDLQLLQAQVDNALQQLSSVEKRLTDAGIRIWAVSNEDEVKS